MLDINPGLTPVETLHFARRAVPKTLMISVLGLPFDWDLTWPVSSQSFKILTELPAVYVGLPLLII